MASLLAGIRVVNAAINLPAGVVGRRLAELGATVTKVEPPAGDPVAAASSALAAELTAGQEVLVLDLRQEAGRESMEELLAAADVLVTSSRPSALAAFGLAWP